MAFDKLLLWESKLVANFKSSTGMIEERQDHRIKADFPIAVLSCFFLAVCAAFSIHQQNPPRVVPAGAPLELFSASRAMKHVVAIAEKPHPIGSAEHAAVRDYIMNELSAAGLAPELQQTIGVNSAGRPLKIGAVKNILARLKGTTGGKSILLVAHYDSAPNSFGANDDGAGVAALLETLRALRRGAALRNDVIFLFSDGEESGLLGAEAFVDEHPWAKSAGVVLNFESRGNSGPVIMFETSDDNGWLIREFARAAPFPIANSLSYEIYKLLPNVTDLNVFKKAGMPGLNFAYIDGVSHYHTLLDKAGEVDERSLQHHGSYALALTRHLGNLELDRTKERNATYFDLFGRVLIHYSALWTIPLAALVFAIFVALMIAGFKKGRLTLGGVALGGVALLFSALISSLATTLLWKGIRLLPGDVGQTSDVAQSGLYLVSFVALAIALTSAIYIPISKRAPLESLFTGGLVWWVMLMALASWFLPGGSFLFVWPLCFSLIGLGLMIFAKGGWKESRPRSHWTFLSLCTVPGIILLVPATHQMFVGLTLDRNYLIIAMVVLLLGLFIPHLQLLLERLKWLLPGMTALAAVVLFVIASITHVNNARHPRTDTIFYGLNADSGRAVWASDDARPDNWSAQFFAAGAQNGTLPNLAAANSSRIYMKSPAPAASLPAPQLELLEDNVVNGTRTMRMRLTSPRQASVMSVYVDSNAEVLWTAVGEKTIDDNRDGTPASRQRRNQWAVRIYGLPHQGIELRWGVRPSEPLKIRLVDQSYGLPQTVAATFQPRPPSLIPSTTAYTDSTFVSKTYVF